jgi:hypothetical protein
MWLVATLFASVLPACFAPQSKPMGEPVTVRVTAVDPARPTRFTVDVAGGEAELRAPQMRGLATDARLTASTPAVVILGPGTTGAAFRALGGKRLVVVAVAPRARLSADGHRVRISSTANGLSIRDY